MKKSENKLLFLSVFLIFFLFILGFWWLYLIFVLDEKLRSLSIPNGIFGENINTLTMLKWEGASFAFLIILMSITFAIVFFRDRRKTKTLSAFFAAFSHELKTPLASIRLQTEVLEETLPQEIKHKNQKLISRLIQDVESLQLELDKILQLSRIELGDQLNLGPLNLKSYLKKFNNQYKDQIIFKVTCDKDSNRILADEYALDIILKNIFDNALKHSQQSKPIQVDIHLSQLNKHNLECVIHDHGKSFKGDIKKVGQLFYKGSQSKGSGIGLYIVNYLMLKMLGQAKFFNQNNNFYVSLSFKLSTGQS